VAGTSTASMPKRTAAMSSVLFPDRTITSLSDRSGLGRSVGAERLGAD
jgi:hypothetical protein